MLACCGDAAPNLDAERVADRVADRVEREVSLGEYKIIEFNGRDRAQTKRKALDYWYQHRDSLKLSLRDFFMRCRSSSDGLKIIFMQSWPAR
ncbi:MAG: hypothetical protein V2A73_08150 [Pseudomonadota bacterium]